MNYLKILLTTCSILSSSFTPGDKTPKLSYSQYLETIRAMECQRIETKANQFVCVVHDENKTTKKKTESKPVFYKSAKINETSFFLVNDTKSQMLQIKDSGVVYHERVLTSDESSEKVCVGLLEEKR